MARAFRSLELCASIAHVTTHNSYRAFISELPAARERVNVISAYLELSSVVFMLDAYEHVIPADTPAPRHG